MPDRALLDHLLSGEPPAAYEFDHPLAAGSRRIAWLLAGLVVGGHFSPVDFAYSLSTWVIVAASAWIFLLLGGAATILSRGAGGSSVYQAAALVSLSSAILLQAYVVQRPSFCILHFAFYI